MKRLFTVALAAFLLGEYALASDPMTPAPATRDLTAAEWRSFAEAYQKAYRDGFGVEISVEALEKMLKKQYQPKSDGGLLGPGFGQ